MSHRRLACATLLGFVAACASARAPAPAAPEHPNRDRHGPADVEAYIERLRSPERLEHLQVDVVLSKLGLPEDAVVGDLGTGPGTFAFAFAAACPAGLVYASDIEPAQLDRLREGLRALGLRNVVPVLASEGDPHFPPDRLDLVFLSDTYHHLEDRVAYFARLRSVLVPGGRLALLEYKPGDLPVGPPADHKLPAGVMDRELAEAGFVLVERFETHRWHDFEVWRARHPWESER